MNRFFAPCRCNDNLDIKEWVLYVHLFSVAYFKDSDNGKIRRGQALFGLRDLSPLIPKTTAARLRDSLAEKGLIIVDKFTKFPNSNNLITLCKYDEINEKSGTLWDTLVGRKWDTLQPDIIEKSAEFEKLRSVDKLLCGNAIDLTDLTSFTNVKDISNDTSLPEHTKPKKQRTPSKPKEYTSSHKVWLAYAEAHTKRYPPEEGKKVWRPRNAYVLINEMLKQVDEEELTKRVKVYVEKLNDPKLVEAKHPLSWLDNRMTEVVGAIRAQQPMKIRSF